MQQPFQYSRCARGNQRHRACGRHRPREKTGCWCCGGVGSATVRAADTPGDRRLNFLLEIGVEEIPDWMLGGALDYLGGAVADLLKQNNLGEVTVVTNATPRRLVLRAQDVKPTQTGSEERVWGPARTAPQ